MADVVEEKIEAKVKEVRAAFADGLQFEDIATVVKTGVEFAEQFGSLNGPEKKALAVQLIGRVIDETDTPWLPDSLTDPLMKRFVPSLIDLVVGASLGEVAVNQ